MSERHDSLHQFLKENEGSRKHDPCFNGHYELICKYTTRGKNKHIVCNNAYKAFHGNEHPINKCLLQRALKLILVENSFQWRKLPTSSWNCHEHQLKMAVAFANNFMVKVEKEILNQSALGKWS